MQKRGKNWNEKNPKSVDLKGEINRNLREQLKNGEGTSKHADKLRALENGIPQNIAFADKIYSHGTFKSYRDANMQAVNWLREQGIKPQSINEYCQNVPKYLEHLKATGKSAWTVNLAASAAAKLYGGSKHDFGVDLPIRRAAERTNNTGVKTYRGERSLMAREADLLEIGRLTGLRRREMEAFRRENHVGFIGGKTDIIELNGKKDNTKGGRNREIPLDRASADRVRELLGQSIRMQKEKPFSGIDKNLNIHRQRHHFAKLMYQKLVDQRELRGIQTTNWYRCRDGSGLKFDKDVALEVSNALGHGRVDTSIINYLR